MKRAGEAVDGENGSAISRRIRVPFDDNSPLAGVGLHSLSVLRITSELITDPDQEIDPTGLAAVHTVGELWQWLHGLLAPKESIR